MNQLLIERVLEQIKSDLAMGYVEAIEELLSFVPKENLIGFLPEEEWERFENDYQCQNCGGGFIREEMDFDVDDVDLCKNCNHRTFNEAPYGEE
jgi:DNA-directed RNA polymerase subunit RPC12/RpoP